MKEMSKHKFIKQLKVLHTIKCSGFQTAWYCGCNNKFMMELIEEGFVFKSSGRIKRSTDDEYGITMKGREYLEKRGKFMGWDGGSEHAESLINVLKDTVDDPSIRQKIYEEMITVWFNDDWDTEDEVRGLDSAFDEAVKAVYKRYGIKNDDATEEDYNWD